LGKVKKDIINVRGKFGDHSIVERRRQDPFIRKNVKAGSKKKEAALQKQYTRTSSLNEFASSFKILMHSAYEPFPSSDLYQKTLSRLRLAKSDSRIGLLYSLKGLELSREYPFNRFQKPKLTITELEKDLRVNLEIEIHPYNRKLWKCKSYYYEMMLLQWKGGSDRPTITRQATDWVNRKGPRPEFEIDFPVTRNTSEWMLIIGINFGENNVIDERFPSLGIKVIEVGSYDDADKEWLEIRKAEEAMANLPERSVKGEEIVRVKAKREK
jgi:hypothetical protein